MLGSRMCHVMIIVLLSSYECCFTSVRHNETANSAVLREKALKSSILSYVSLQYCHCRVNTQDIQHL